MPRIYHFAANYLHNYLDFSLLDRDKVDTQKNPNKQPPVFIVQHFNIYKCDRYHGNRIHFATINRSDLFGFWNSWPTFRSITIFTIQFTNIHYPASRKPIQLHIAIVSNQNSYNTMNTIQVIAFVVVSMLMLVQCEPPKPNVDEKCLVPPPNDVDPMQCCKIPELLDSKLIETCATKVYGPDSNPANQNEPPFAPHIRVSVHHLLCIVIVVLFQK